jgi:hypothetical protein
VKQYFKEYMLICCLMLLVTSCATTTAFQYDHPQSKNQLISDKNIAVAYPKDGRKADEQVDKLWKNNPLDDIDKIVREEIGSTGLFKQIVAFDNEEDIDNIRMVLNTTIKELAWEIPNQKEQERKALLISVFTGGIGGLAYGSGDTDFYGKAKIRIVLVDREANQDILDKEYYFRIAEKMARLKTDSADERARIIGKAFKHVMEQFKTDLDYLAKAGRI